MKFISHRGNIETKIISEENKPEKIMLCIRSGYDVEIDVWYKNDDWWLGHDEPQYKVNADFLKNPNLWCHAKNLNSFQKMLEYGIHCFWHQNDDYTITSKGFIWVYPNKLLSQKTIAVLPEITNYSIENLKMCYGICSDKIKYYKENL